MSCRVYTDMAHSRPVPQVIHVDDAERTEIAPGIIRRRLTETGVARAWLIEFAPGTQWPRVDTHETEERYYVLRGEIIEGDATYPEGSYVTFPAGSGHQPRTLTGVSILGINQVQEQHVP